MVSSWLPFDIEFIKVLSLNAQLPKPLNQSF